MTKLRQAWLILRYLGPRWVCFRIGYALQRRLGVLARRSPCRKWSEIPATATVPDWLDASALPASAKEWGNRCVAEADGLSLGEFVLFSRHLKHLGAPPNWRRNPFTGQEAPRGRHWSELGDFNFGDIKAIWEPSRFGWAFTLARAHARTGEARLAELFWKLFEDWCAKNPPNQGVNWKCGQEATFRLIAVTFAIAHFGRLPSATPARLELWSKFVAVTGERIAANVEYALHQSNNHGVSECVGLITASLLVSSEKQSRAWSETGFRELRKQLDELVYADGGFAQHSLMYHRVLLHDLLWTIHILRRCGQRLPDWLVEKSRRALDFLRRLVDAKTGGAPVYGPNDGSNILPLDECAFDDLRGTVQAGSVLLDQSRTYPPGPWDESAFWLTGNDPAELPLLPSESVRPFHARQSGVFQWDSASARIFLRCPVEFRHRPTQADMLHADVWWNGRAVAHDAGTFSYNTPERFGGEFAKASAHSVAMLARREPMKKASRFLYLPWPRGEAGWVEEGKKFRATHEAYGQDACLERCITHPSPGVFAVTDAVTVREPGIVRLHWLLAEADWKLDEIALAVSATFEGGIYTISWNANIEKCAMSLVRADAQSARGWWSRYYLEAEPAVSLELLFEVRDRLEVTTRFAHRSA